MDREAGGDGCAALEAFVASLRGRMGVRDGAVPLPESVTLEVGVTYTWEVAARTPDGILHSSWGDFVLATDAERALIEQMRPPSDAPFSSRVMFAVVLQQLELRDEALNHWKTLLAERSDDPKLQQMVGQ